MGKGKEELLTFGGHLEVLRRMLFRIIAAVAVIAVLVFCFKDTTFELLLAPTSNSFCLYGWVENLSSLLGLNFKFEERSTDIIESYLFSATFGNVETSKALWISSITFSGAFI